MTTSWNYVNPNSTGQHYTQDQLDASLKSSWAAHQAGDGLTDDQFNHNIYNFAQNNGIDWNTLARTYGNAGVGSFTGDQAHNYAISHGYEAPPANDPFTIMGNVHDWLKNRSSAGGALGSLGSLGDAGRNNYDLYSGKINGLLSNPSSITMTPGSQFAMQQGLNALAAKAAAQGRSGSGNILSELQNLGQGYAAQDYHQQLTDLTGLQQNAGNLSLGAYSSQGQVGNGMDANAINGAIGSMNATTSMDQASANAQFQAGQLANQATQTDLQYLSSLAGLSHAGGGSAYSDQIKQAYAAQGGANGAQAYLFKQLFPDITF